MASAWLQTLMTLGSEQGLGDFGSFLASARALDRGDDPYRVYPLSIATSGLPSPNLNPPISLLFFRPLAHLDPILTLQVWTLVSFVLYALVASWLLLDRTRRSTWLDACWVFAIGGFWDTLEMGQLYVSLFAIGTGAWVLSMRGRLAVAGALLGLLVAIKPNLALWPALLLLAGHRRVAVIAFVVALAVSFVPLAIHGPIVYAQWLAGVSSYTGIWYPTNGSLPGLAHRLGQPSAGALASAALLLYVAVWATHTHPSIERTHAGALSCALLVSPISWTGYALLLVPRFVGRPWGRALAAAAGLLAFPGCLTWFVIRRSYWGMLLFGSIHCYALLLVLADTLASDDRDTSKVDLT